MTLEDFTKLIESHGADPSNWPESAREESIEFVSNEPMAAKVQGEHVELESLLDDIEVPDFPGLSERVMYQSLPPKESPIIDRFLNWLIPESLGLELWRPITAACLPLAFGIIIGNFYSFGINNDDIALEYWDDELALLSFNDFSDEYSELGN